MNRMSAFVCCLAVMACFPASAQDGPLATEGHGLLPEPSAAADATLGGVAPAHPFVSDPSGGFSRVLFQSSDDANFNVTIRDYSFPPDKQARSVTLPAGALLQLRNDVAAVTVAKQRVEAAAAARVAVPAGAPIEVTNGGDSAAVIRVFLFEAK
jgi:hypothetical protein